MKERLLSLDVFRGLTIALMILVNNPGSWAHIYPPLRHAAWHGWTPTDLVFPFFLFIVGVAMALSLARRSADGADRGDLVRKILVRTGWIFLMGLFLNGFPFGFPLNAQSAAQFTWSDIPGSLDDLRIPGVLQRIALCYATVALAVVLIPTNRYRHLFMISLFLIYEAAMRLHLVPGWGGGSFELEDNLARLVDLRLLGAAHINRVGEIPFDSEGLLSTLPAVLTTYAGYLTGLRLLLPGHLTEKLRTMVAVGAALFVAGWLARWLEPINKQLWTGSYVLLTAGLALLTLALCMWAMDVKGWKTGTAPLVAFGSNPLVLFLGSGLMARIMVGIRVPTPEGGTISAKGWIYKDLLVPWAGETLGSLVYAVLTVLIWWGVAWFMYRRGWFIRV